MLSKINKFIAITVVSICFTACFMEKDMGEDLNPVKNTSFNLENHFVAGTLGTGSSKNVIIVRFLDHEKAVFSQNYVDLVAKYTFSDKKYLVIEVKEDANYRILKFDLNDKNEIIFGYYQALTQVSPIDASLVEIAEKNQFANTTFKGSETVYIGYSKTERPTWYYKFDGKAEKFGAGSDISALSVENKIEIINNSAFKYYESATNSAIGFINADGILTVSGRNATNSFLGTYEKQ